MGRAMIALLAYVAGAWCAVGMGVALIISRMIRERDRH